MNPYDRYLLPYLLDWVCGLGVVRRQRARVVPQARGRILEVGIGTGLNLAHYDHARIDGRLQGLDPATQVHRLARKRARRAGLDVELLTLSAEAIPAPDASFDTVVTTFTLCTIPDPMKALREMHRVLKPDGRLLYCEHGRAPEESVYRWQIRLTPWWKPLAGGCHLDRDIPALLQAGGFVPETAEAVYLPGPRVLMYNYFGCARPG